MVKLINDKVQEYLLRVLNVAYMRFFLLIKQKLGWVCSGISFLFFFVSIALAQVSYLNSGKLFWDFSLGIIFVLQIVMTIYLAGSLFHDEKDRKTLHLVLSTGVSRIQWLLGNALGIWVALTLFHLMWMILCFGISVFYFPLKSYSIVFQSTVLLSMEVAVLIGMMFSISMMLRKFLVLFAGSALMFFLHSIDSLERVFTDPQVGYVADANSSHWILWIARLFPPFEWYDIRIFVGYQNQISSNLSCYMLLLTMSWVALFGFLSWLIFEKKDL